MVFGLDEEGRGAPDRAREVLDMAVIRAEREVTIIDRGAAAEDSHLRRGRSNECTNRVDPCIVIDMGTQRLNITLDDEHAGKLSRLAARVHVNEGTLARSLLSSAIDDADPDAETVVAVLDGIDQAWERATLGRRQAAAGDTVPLEGL